MIRASLLAFALVGSTAVQATALQPERSEAPEPQQSATEAASTRPAGPPAQAPRPNDRPQKRDTCERQSGLPSIRGRAGNDRIYGSTRAYRMFGDEDRDFLLGGSEDDEIDGGDDADVLIGGSGADLFVYDTDFASLADKKGRWSSLDGDTIVDFRNEERDRIDLTALKKYGPGAPTALQWSGSLGQPYSVWTLPRDGDTVVAADLDGDALADFAVRLLGEVDLTRSSFCGLESEPL